MSKTTSFTKPEGVLCNSKKKKKDDQGRIWRWAQASLLLETPLKDEGRKMKKID
jgi:hypothetical protein